MEIEIFRRVYHGLAITVVQLLLLPLESGDIADVAMLPVLLLCYRCCCH